MKYMEEAAGVGLVERLVGVLVAFGGKGSTDHSLQ